MEILIGIVIIFFVGRYFYKKENDSDGNNYNITIHANLIDSDYPASLEVNTYKIIYREPGTEWFFYSGNPLTYDPETNESAARERLRKFENVRTERFKEKFEMNNAWMKGLDRDEVAKVNNDFRKWIDGDQPAAAEPEPMVQ